MNARGWLVLERAQALLPVLIAGGLAAFTWWLVSSSPKPGGPVSVEQASSAPDYELSKARVARFDAQGRVAAVLDGTAMRHYADTDRLQIDQLVASARDKHGQTLHAVARQGEVDHRAQVITLRGGAQVTALPAASAASGAAPGGRGGGPVRFVGEMLRIDTGSHIVSSDEPVWLSQGRNQVQARNLVYNDGTGVATLGGRVRGRYEEGAPGRLHKHAVPAVSGPGG